MTNKKIKNIKIFFASDHAGFALKSKLIEALKKENESKYESENPTEILIEDCGPYSNESVDYPDYADAVCKKIKTSVDLAELEEFGVLICGSAQGMAMRANKFLNIRAALVWNEESVSLSREHNNANIICIGARFCNFETALNWINLFKKTSFAQGRHQTRVAKVSKTTA